MKTNLGHLESAAGVAGFIKTVLSVHRGSHPQAAALQKLTPAGGRGGVALHHRLGACDWPAVDAPTARGGVLVRRQRHQRARRARAGARRREAGCGPTGAARSPRWSSPARPRPGSRRRPAGWPTGWRHPPGRASAAARRSRTPSTTTAPSTPSSRPCAACDRAQAVAGLRALAGGYRAPGVVPPTTGACASGTVFVYSGQGSQWAGMGRRVAGRRAGVRRGGRRAGTRFRRPGRVLAARRAGSPARP